MIITAYAESADSVYGEEGAGPDSGARKGTGQGTERGFFDREER